MPTKLQNPPPAEEIFDILMGLSGTWKSQLVPSLSLLFGRVSQTPVIRATRETYRLGLARHWLGKTWSSYRLG